MQSVLTGDSAELELIFPTTLDDGGVADVYLGRTGNQSLKMPTVHHNHDRHCPMAGLSDI